MFERHDLPGQGCEFADTIPDLRALRNKVVIRIDHQQCRDLFVVCQMSHSFVFHAGSMGINVRNE
ncbi:hypothetical protein CI1B_20480 [Bradyrhizobium ivorense]|uniref:Uncharacterized protein n=1 Tax=Bradyrhizobium ivorense TaxID=2511166 RepID=A0A508T5G8_9BRAD|nr:hypothetical protein CI1B_20480 [Bradyrhizobium ivorense]